MSLFVDLKDINKLTNSGVIQVSLLGVNFINAFCAAQKDLHSTPYYYASKIFLKVWCIA